MNINISDTYKRLFDLVNTGSIYSEEKTNDYNTLIQDINLLNYWEKCILLISCIDGYTDIDLKHEKAQNLFSPHKELIQLISYSSSGRAYRFGKKRNNFQDVLKLKFRDSINLERYVKFSETDLGKYFNMILDHIDPDNTIEEYLDEDGYNAEKSIAINTYNTITEDLHRNYNSINTTPQLETWFNIILNHLELPTYEEWKKD